MINRDVTIIGIIVKVASLGKLEISLIIYGSNFHIEENCVHLSLEVVKANGVKIRIHN